MTKAIAKYIRMSPRKLRRVIDEVRGKNANEAQVILKFMPYAAARVVEKVLKSAVSNAKQNDNLNPESLTVTKAFVDQANTLKRWRPMSRGRGYSILKRISHVTIEVDEKGKELKSKDKPTKTAKTVDKHEHNHEHGQCNHDHDEVKLEKPKAKKKSSTTKKKDKE